MMGARYCVVGPLRTDYGDEQSLFVRLNHIDGLNDHGAPALATFRGFSSRSAFEDGRRYLWEQTIQIRANCWGAPGPIAWAELSEYFAATGATVTEEGGLE
ncbi:hypothetical protein [Burkholderia cepacia]|uniref:hypothetical protein n=1 Tax=Burkholderia cepacia TaxID=292 RepID=UPI002ABDA7E9|nr:hypothetical protein [Burkholderia cepacia]